MLTGTKTNNLKLDRIEQIVKILYEYFTVTG
jgi:hypothetical protein